MTFKETRFWENDILWGREVVLTGDDLLQTCLAIQKERDMTGVQPNGDLIIAGQGTIGLEALEDVLEVYVVLIGVAGAGLICGMCADVKSKKPKVSVVGMEAEGASAMSQSLEGGEPV